jgi:hypothetical protein
MVCAFAELVFPSTKLTRADHHFHADPFRLGVCQFHLLVHEVQDVRHAASLGQHPIPRRDLELIGQANDRIKSPHASPIAAPRVQVEDDVFSGGSIREGQSSEAVTSQEKALRMTGRAVIASAKWTLSVLKHEAM